MHVCFLLWRGACSTNTSATHYLLGLRWKPAVWCIVWKKNTHKKTNIKKSRQKLVYPVSTRSCGPLVAVGGRGSHRPGQAECGERCGSVSCWGAGRVSPRRLGRKQTLPDDHNLHRLSLAGLVVLASHDRPSHTVDPTEYGLWPRVCEIYKQ